jgi:site-specific recombinase XerC
MAKGKTDFIFQRPGSDNYWIKLRSPDKRIERSLGTPDRQLADVLAAPMIADHKRKLLEARPRIEPTWRHDYAPGREHVAPDGGRIFATDREVYHLDAQGVTVRTTTNGGPAFQLSSVPRLGLSVPVPIEVTDTARPTLARKNSDDAILETYLAHAGIVGYYEREARAVWALYKQLTGSKALKDATRDDGRKLVTHFEGQGLKSATITKKIGWLTAGVNLAISESKLTFNPFSAVVPKRDDKQTRLPLDDADMKAIKSNLDGLDESDRVLVRLLGSTGMRLAEAFEIDGELKERGLRYVIVGKKTEQSERRVPLPAAMLKYLPKLITGKLFKGDAKDAEAAASKRLNRFLDDIGITDPRKVVHSLRHRAQDRLRAADCPEDKRWAILGHEEKTVAAGYGEGFSVKSLKPWVDKIGF